MRNFYPSFKSRIIIFYILFGLIPMLLISYYSFKEASKSILDISQNQTSELIKNVASQTEDFYKNTISDIYQMAENPLVQLSFLQFSYGQRMDSVRDRLILYRANSDIYKSILLYNKDNKLILKIPDEADNKIFLSNAVIADALNKDFSVFRDSNSLYLLKRVYDFEDLSVPVGVLIFQIENNKFVRFLKNLRLTKETVKIIQTDQGVVYKENILSENQKYRYFEAKANELGWMFSIYVPETYLFKKINILQNKTLVFVFTVTILALIAALYFTEKLIKPIKKVIKGTKEFANGNFKYRINMKKGREIKLLADSFDKMAENIEKRQEELIQANKLASLGLLSAGIAHEIKNPLAGIKTTAQLMLKKEENKNSQILIKSIIEETDRLNRTLVNMLNFAKPTPAKIEQTDLKEIVEYSANLLEKEFENKNIKINIEVEDILVMVDKDQLTQILINLILNAIQSINKKIGIINIYSEVTNENINLIIQDNGKGIDSKNLHKIFDPFFSLNASGSGLGLSVVFNLLKQNNINIKVDSEVDIGTKITLSFRGKFDV